jgi:pimeloyl-ACP methyl ester carboxylesterase
MDMSARKSFLASDGICIRYRENGAGTPVVLLHGFSMSSGMWWENHVVETLAGSYRLLIPDMRGHGDSDCPHDPASYGSALVSDIAELIGIEAPSGAHVVGFSMGAELSLPLAVGHPSAVRSIYLVGSGWSPIEIVDEYRIHMQWARSKAENERSGNDLAALSALVEAVEATVGLTEAQIAALDVPMAGIAGELDVERPYLERLARARPDFDLDILPGVDHMASWRDPRLPAKIGRFLDAQSH